MTLGQFIEVTKDVPRDCDIAIPSWALDALSDVFRVNYIKSENFLTLEDKREHLAYEYNAEPPPLPEGLTLEEVVIFEDENAMFPVDTSEPDERAWMSIKGAMALGGFVLNG
jgi:hypothetical protein